MYFIFQQTDRLNIQARKSFCTFLVLSFIGLLTTGHVTCRARYVFRDNYIDTRQTRVILLKRVHCPIVTTIKSKYVDGKNSELVNDCSAHTVFSLCVSLFLYKCMCVCVCVYVCVCVCTYECSQTVPRFNSMANHHPRVYYLLYLYVTLLGLHRVLWI